MTDKLAPASGLADDTGRGVPFLMTVDEVADVMRVSRMTVYRLIRRGQLTAVRVGRHYRVRDNALRDYLDRSEV